MHFFLCKIKLISINKINLFKLHRKKYSIIKLLYSFKQARQQRKCELCRLCWTKKDEVSKNCFFLYHKFVFPHHFLYQLSIFIQIENIEQQRDSQQSQLRGGIDEREEHSRAKQVDENQKAKDHGAGVAQEGQRVQHGGSEYSFI